MKRHKILFQALAAAMLVVSCSEYDDSSLWKQVDEAQKQIAELTASLTELESQIGLLSAAKNGGLITSIQENTDGGFTIKYTTSDGKEATAIIAGKDDIKSVDIIGTKEENGVLYWTITVGGKTTILTDNDGAKIPVAGRTPSFTTDKDGYWMANGSYILDSKGDKIKSSGHKASLIAGAEKNEDGSVTLTLADGSKFTVDTAESFSLKVFFGGKEVKDELKVEDGTTSLEFTYSLTGKAVENAVLKVTRVESVEASVDEAGGKIKVTVPDPLRKGQFTLMAADESGHLAVRTVRMRGTFSVETENELWKTVEEKLLAPGCNYYSMEFKNITRRMHVLEIDLTNPAIEVTTSYADDIVPNPNGNANKNNGFNLRETLSQLCARKTAAGEDVIAGVNTGYFDSNDGIQQRSAHRGRRACLYEQPCRCLQPREPLLGVHDLQGQHRFVRKESLLRQNRSGGQGICFLLGERHHRARRKRLQNEIIPCEPLHLKVRQIPSPGAPEHHQHTQRKSIIPHGKIFIKEYDRERWLV